MAKKIGIKRDNRKKSLVPERRINDEITGFGRVRVIGDEIESREMNLDEAKRYAESLNLDLIEINGNIPVPILRIGNYDKFLYEEKKAKKKSLQNQNKGQVKEIQLSVSIAENDMQVKANKAREFIKDECKVKVVLRMRGRELIRREENKKSIFTFIDMLSDVAVAEAMPKDEGNRTIVILRGKRK